MQDQSDQAFHAQPQEQTLQTQLALRDVLLLVTSVALLLAYARSIGPSAVQLAAIYAAISLAVGLSLGFATKRVMDVLFWTCLATLLAYLAVAGGRLPNLATAIGWGSVGAVCGAYSGLSRGSLENWNDKAILRLLAHALICGLLALGGLTLTLVLLQEPITGLVMFDVAFAGIVGAILFPFMRFLRWFQRRSQQPRAVLACWLTLVILFGNFMVPILAGVQR